MDGDLIHSPIVLPYMFSALVHIMRDILGTVVSGDGVSFRSAGGLSL